jgi:hypothetical protein
LAPAHLADSGHRAHSVSAVVIRDLLPGRHGDLGPGAVHLAGARVSGQLNLADVHGQARLTLRGCHLADPVPASEAHLLRFVLADCHLPGLHADGLRVDGDVVMRGAVITDSRPEGLVRLPGARIGGTMDGTSLNAPGGPVLDLEHATTPGPGYRRTCCAPARRTATPTTTGRSFSTGSPMPPCPRRERAGGGGCTGYRLRLGQVECW